MLPDTTLYDDADNGFMIINYIFNYDLGNNYIETILKMFLKKPCYSDIKDISLPEKYCICRGIINEILHKIIHKYINEYAEYFDINDEYELFPMQLVLFEKKMKENNQFLSELLSRSSKHLGITIKEFEKNPAHYFSKLGYDFSIFEKYQKINKYTTSIYEKVHFIEFIMGFPPLHNISKIMYLMKEKYEKAVRIISNSFDKQEINYIPISMIYSYSFNQLPQELVDKLSIDELIHNEHLSEYKDSLIQIKSIIENNNEVKINKEYICPHCGIYHDEITVTGRVVLYKLLFEDDNLSKAIAFEYLPEYIEIMKKELFDILLDFKNSINAVENPKCIIFVEGDSELHSIPIISIAYGIDLNKSRIKVFNSGTKQKLFDDFIRHKKQYPNLPLIALFDSDAKKEADDLERCILDQKDKYRIFIIKDGTFEDLFNIQISIKILNKMYPDGEKILFSDFDKKKHFIENINKVLFTKKKASFDKVKFSVLVSIESIKENKLPTVIVDVLSQAKQYTNIKNEK